MSKKKKGVLDFDIEDFPSGELFESGADIPKKRKKDNKFREMFL